MSRSRRTRAEWTDFLSAYHEGVLGWVGGSERIEGVPPTEEAVADRLRLLRESVDRVFGGSSFEAVWTLHRPSLASVAEGVGKARTRWPQPGY